MQVLGINPGLLKEQLVILPTDESSLQSLKISPVTKNFYCILVYIYTCVYARAHMHYGTYGRKKTTCQESVLSYHVGSHTSLPAPVNITGLPLFLLNTCAHTYLYTKTSYLSSSDFFKNIRYSAFSTRASSRSVSKDSEKPCL